MLQDRSRWREVELTCVPREALGALEREKGRIKVKCRGHG